jgi:LysM repeat protein
MKRLTIFAILIIGILLVIVLPAKAQPITNSSVIVTCSNIQVNLSLSNPTDVHIQAYLNTLGESNRLFARRIFNNQSGSFSQTINYDTTVPSGSTVLYLVNFFTPGTTTNLGAVTGSTTCTTSATTVITPIPDNLTTWLNPANVLAPIRVHCTQQGSVAIVAVDNQVGMEVFRVTPAQIGNGIGLARKTGLNVQIGAGRGQTGLWALTSNELQATRRGGGLLDYDFVFPFESCGPITVPSSPQSVVLTTGTPTSTIAATPGAVSTPTTTTFGACGAPSGARAAYVVQRGDNLFRIGLRYGVSYVEIARYNGITNPARILEGQCIIIP